MNITGDEQWTRVTGVIISLVGAFIVSPEAPKHLLIQLKGWIVRTLERLRAWLTVKFWMRLPPRIQWFFPFLEPRKAWVASGAMSGAIGIAGTAGGRAVWNTNADLPDRLNTIERAVDSLRDQLDNATDAIRSNRETADLRMNAIEASIARAEGTLRTHIEELKRDSLTTDARAFPVIGIGVFLSGLAQDIVTWWDWLWWTVMALSVSITAAVSYVALRDFIARKRPEIAQNMPENAR